MNGDIINLLSGFLTDNRRRLFHQVLEKRTRYLTVVLEDIFQSHNASAVLRTCDCFGIQDVHIIENINQFEVNPKVVRGASKWLSLHHYNQEENNTVSTLSKLKSQGYRIIATTPHDGDVELENFDLKKGKIALVFGTEMKGISAEVTNNADGFLKIPMYGFTESFNISVSAAIILHHLTYRLNQLGLNYQLSEKEKEDILMEWLKSSIKDSELMIKTFLRQK